MQSDPSTSFSCGWWYFLHGVSPTHTSVQMYKPLTRYTYSAFCEFCPINQPCLLVVVVTRCFLVEINCSRRLPYMGSNIPSHALPIKNIRLHTWWQDVISAHHWVPLVYSDSNFCPNVCPRFTKFKNIPPSFSFNFDFVVLDWSCFDICSDWYSQQKDGIQGYGVVIVAIWQLFFSVVPVLRSLYSWLHAWEIHLSWITRGIDF